MVAVAVRDTFPIGSGRSFTAVDLEAVGEVRGDGAVDGKAEAVAITGDPDVSVFIVPKYLKVTQLFLNNPLCIVMDYYFGFYTVICTLLT